MKIYLAIFFTFISIGAWAQKDTSAAMKRQPYYQRHNIIATVSLGFADPYRQYTLPSGFEKDNTSGYALFYGKVEYGLTKDIGISVTAGYDAFVYNFSQLYTGFNGPIKRYIRDNMRIFSAGVTGFYHLGRLIEVKRLDPFVGVGISLNNIRQRAYPQGDSTMIKLDHTATPYLKAGARYYISNKFSIFGDVGYDKQSIFSVGFSCRFEPKR